MVCIKLNCDKNFIYVIIYWILEIIFLLILNLKSEYFIMTDDIVKNEYMFVIFLNIADLLSGFLVLYVKKSSKSVRKEEFELLKFDTKNQTNQLIYEETMINLKKNFVKKVILIAVLDYLSRSFFWIAYAISGVKKEEVSQFLERDMINSIDVFMRYIFSIFILKTKLYKHLIVSIFGTVIGFIILVVTDFLIIAYTENNIALDKTAYFIGILLLRGFSFPFEDTLVYQLFKDNNLLPQSFQFLRGIFEMIIIIIITPILFFSFGLELDFHFGVEQTVTMIFYTIGLFVKAYFLIRVIYHFSFQSVSFLVISESFGESIIEIIKIIKDKDKNTIDVILLILEIIGILIILFSSLIYNEIIIINKWGLNRNVKGDIMIRGELEMQIMKKNDPLQLRMTLMDNGLENYDTKNELIEEGEDEFVLENCYSGKDSSKVSYLENDIDEN